jgi:outer membrane protein OmpA-like peptidoglycan-associated protein
MRAKIALISVALLCLASSLALAQPTSGPYLGVQGGWNLPFDSDFDAPTAHGTAEFNDGWVAGITGGYGFGNGLRLELEFDYRRNDIDTLKPGGGSGETNVINGMVNALYDFQTRTAFTPYLGVGIGWANVEWTDLSGTLTGSDDDNVFAYQGIAGVAYGVTPNLKLSIDYRYFATEDPEFEAVGGGTIDTEYQAHTVMVGLRYEFGAPARPSRAEAPAPVAPPAPSGAPSAAPLARTFLVFFDFGQANLTPEAMQIVRNAATNAQRGGVSRIVVTGHADRAGSAQYNEALSRRRAENVRTALTREGISPSQIIVQGRGESDPLIQTADGVREPQNRRVEIVLEDAAVSSLAQ